MDKRCSHIGIGEKDWHLTWWGHGNHYSHVFSPHDEQQLLLKRRKDDKMLTFFSKKKKRKWMRREQFTLLPDRGYISIIAIAPASHVSCPTVSCFSMQGKRGWSEIGPHIQIQASTSPPALLPPPAICARLSACKLHNIEALNLRREVNPSPEKRESGAESVGKRRAGEGGVLVGGEREKLKGGRGEEKRKWDAMKLNHREGRVGQKRGTD